MWRQYVPYGKIFLGFRQPIFSNFEVFNILHIFNIWIFDMKHVSGEVSIFSKGDYLFCVKYGFSKSWTTRNMNNKTFRNNTWALIQSFSSVELGRSSFLCWFASLHIWIYVVNNHSHNFSELNGLLFDLYIDAHFLATTVFQCCKFLDYMSVHNYLQKGDIILPCHWRYIDIYEDASYTVVGKRAKCKKTMVSQKHFIQDNGSFKIEMFNHLLRPFHLQNLFGLRRS